MENRKSYVLIIAIVIAISVFFAHPALAYEVGTHTYLTSEAVELYNKSAGNNKITAELKRFMIDGVAHEDDLPRPQNHFYDPINNKGLNGGFFGGISAKKWANDSSEQKKIEYKPGAATSLAPVDQKKIDAYGKVTDFTWDAGIRYWLNGDKEMAMEVLGHVLHLVEDMGVPEHTRNDSHAKGSKYEEYVGRYNSNTPDEQLKARLGNKKMVSSESLDKYFDGLAKYSNKYFYSPGSIGEYNFPELDFKTAEPKQDGLYYFKSKDDEENQYFLATQRDLNDVYGTNSVNTSVITESVLESYWSLLSVRTVRYSAGVIDLFFRDVEKAKNDPSFLKAEQPSIGILGKVSALTGSFFGKAKNIVVKTGSFLSNLFNTVGEGLSSAGSFIGDLFTGNDGLTALGVVGLDDTEGLDTGSDGSSGESSAPTAAAVKKDTLAKKNDEITALKMQIEGLQKDAQAQDEALLQLEKKKDEPVAEEKADTIQTRKTVADAPLCVYGSAGTARQGGVVINEVAWMGGVRSASDEWIELKNVSGSDIDISEWQLLNKGGGIKIRLSGLKSPTIKAGKFILLERTDNNSATGATADLIYSGALGNTNDGLQLFDGSCGVVDEIPVASKWPAGNNDTKQTMERDAYGRGWHTSFSAGGTAKKENSAGVAQLNGGGSVAGTSVNSGQGGDPLSLAPQFYPVVINEIMYDVPGSDSGREWIELYNSGTSAATISEWKFFEDETGHALTIKQGSPTVPAGGYAIITADVNGFLNDNGGFEGVIFDSTFSLHNDGETIAVKNGPLVIDSVTYATSTGANGYGMSLQRFESGWSAASSTPGRMNVLAPSAGEQIPDFRSELAELSTSTILWDGGSQAGMVYDLSTDGFVGQRMSFAQGVDVGTIKFGYYNDHASGSTEVKLFSVDGSSVWADTLAVPRVSYGGYIEYVFLEPLHLTVGDYFIGSRLISGTIGIRKGYGSNPCGNAIYGAGNIPECIDGDDVSMIVGRFTATTTPIISNEIPGQTQDDSEAQFYPIVINEIMYDLPGSDDGREWIEVHNAGTTTVDIGEWKFFEDETHHGLTAVQGTSVLPVGGYAVIVASSSAFLNDNAGYSGSIFDSAFSLSNTGESLALKNGDLVIDSIVYASSAGAGGDGMSLQRFDDGWHAASSTPGAVNAVQVIAEQRQESASEAEDMEDESSASELFGQSDHSARSVPYDATVYIQTLGENISMDIRTVDIYAEIDQPTRWAMGICRLPEGNSTKCLQNIVASAGLRSIDTPNVKTLLSFAFSTPFVSDPSRHYGLYIQPITGLTNSLSSVYGSSGDAYAAGAVLGFDGAAPFNTGIKDMYFVINAPVVPAVIPDDPPAAEQETATTTIDAFIPPEGQGTSTAPTAEDTSVGA